MRVVLATHNKHKIKEISDVINHPEIKIESLLDYPDIVLPPETGETFVENALAKADSTLQQITISLPQIGGGLGRGVFILADDSGLVVSALNGRPGVYSSRYSGEPVDYDRNNKKLLQELANVPFEKRTAHFVCSMVLIDPDGKEQILEGRVSGLITSEPKGTGGFGYDPIFYLPDKKCTIAELPLSEKNKISHRGLASLKTREILIEFLNKRV